MKKLPLICLMTFMAILTSCSSSKSLSYSKEELAQIVDSGYYTMDVEWSMKSYRHFNGLTISMGGMHPIPHEVGTFVLLGDSLLCKDKFIGIPTMKMLPIIDRESRKGPNGEIIVDLTVEWYLPAFYVEKILEGHEYFYDKETPGLGHGHLELTFGSKEVGVKYHIGSAPIDDQFVFGKGTISRL